MPGSSPEGFPEWRAGSRWRSSARLQLPARRLRTSGSASSHWKTRITTQVGACGRSTSSTRSSTQVDSVTLCLSKGLGCPLGALLAGPEELIARAWREKHLFGGAMRQAGIVAAAGVYALDNHFSRLADDHIRAFRLAEGLASAGIAVDLEQVETNFVQVDLAPLGIERAATIAMLAERGVGFSTTIHPTVMRAVTHLEITDEDIERAIEIVAGSFSDLAATA